MNSLFSTDFFQGNRRRLRAAVPAGIPIVVTANGLVQRTADNSFPFAQDSNFWYLTGIDEPDITLVLLDDAEYLLIPTRSVSRQAFDGNIDTSQLRITSGITVVYDETEGWAQFAKQCAVAKQIATPAAAPQYIEQIGLYPNPSRARLAETIHQHISNCELLDIRPEIAALRVVKQPAELAAIEEAIKITSDSLLLLTEPDTFALFHDEYEVEADLTREFRRRGAAGHAFAPIVAGGERACTLHNVSNQAPLLPDTLVVLDVGAEVEHYAADITRTLAWGVPSVRQQAVFDAVLDVQAYALTLLKPGVYLKEYEQAVEDYMGETLQKLQLITLAGDPVTDHEAIREYYPHATSHFLGLDVHDVGDYTQPLAPDMVLTCEPGIYIAAESIGVRVEDDILITADGNRVLSADLPKALM